MPYTISSNALIGVNLVWLKYECKIHNVFAFLACFWPIFDKLCFFLFFFVIVIFFGMPQQYAGTGTKSQA